MVEHKHVVLILLNVVAVETLKIEHAPVTFHNVIMRKPCLEEMSVNVWSIHKVVVSFECFCDGEELFVACMWVCFFVQIVPLPIEIPEVIRV